MSAACETKVCDHDRWVMPYLDGELDAVHLIEFEEHLIVCGSCRAHADAWRVTRASVKNSCRMVAPSHLRARLEQMLVDDEHGEEAHGATNGARSLPPADPERAPEVVPLRRKLQRSLLPMVAAAAAIVVVGSSALNAWYVTGWSGQQASALKTKDSALKTKDLALKTKDSARSKGNNPANMVAVKSSRFDQLLDDLVVHHAHPPPVETTDPEGLRRFDPYVGVAVRRPQLDGMGAKYVGGRMHRGTAMLQYVLDRSKKRRMTMYVFHPKNVPMRTKRLRPRMVNTRSVYTGRVNGYSVAASEKNGVGYVLASDLPDDRNAEIVMKASP